MQAASIADRTQPDRKPDCTQSGLPRPWAGGRLLEALAEAGAQSAIATLRFYKYWISPLLPSACRFYPTCSEYMLEAVQRHGLARGVWMGLKRLSRCHPFHAGGCDPVP